MSDEVLAETATFVERRLEGVLAELGYAYDVVDAVLGVRGDNPAAAVRAADALTAMVAQPDWSDVFTAYAALCPHHAQPGRAAGTQSRRRTSKAVEGELQAAYDAAAAAMAKAAANRPRSCGPC